MIIFFDITYSSNYGADDDDNDDYDDDDDDDDDDYADELHYTYN